MYYVYVLRSERSGIFYKGITDNLERRFREHSSNKNVATRGKGPWKLAYCEECGNRVEARDREKYLKSGTGREVLKEILGA